MKLFCPISGLQLFTQDNWREQKLGEHFTANFYVVGQFVLYSGPFGMADMQSAKAVLQLSDEVSRKIAGETGRYVQIEDYAALNKATIDARKYFIDQMASRNRLVALIFCNLSPMMQLFVKIGTKFNPTKKSVYVVRNYKDAINTAIRLCNDLNLGIGPFAFEKQVTYRDDIPTLIPFELISNSKWDVKIDNYKNRGCVIDRCILHSVSSGFFQEAHVPLVEDMRFRVREKLSSNENIDYIVVDTAALEGVSRKARKLYMQSLNAWFKRFPFRMYIMYGANPFMRTAIRLAKPLMPFKIKIAKNIGHAFELIQEDKHSQNENAPTLQSDPIQRYQEELLAYIGSIDWEQEGSGDVFDTVDQKHPFFDVFQAIKLVKNELDDLLNEQKLIQAALKKSEEKYRDLFEKGSDWLCFHDFEGYITETNAVLKEEFGWNKDKSPRLNLKDLITERYRHQYDGYIERIKSKGRDKGLLNISTSDGREIILDYNNVLIYDSSGNPIGVKGSARNITERVQAARENKKILERLQQSQKMEAIGTLAGGIAHEFNNILGIIIGNAELAIYDIPEWNPAKDFLEEIRNASLRAKDVVRQILSFARKTPATRKPIKISTIIKESLKLIRVTIPKSIELRQEILCDPEMIFANPTEINQILMNLCSNSVHAMEDETGILEVRLETAILSDRLSAQYEDLTAGEYVKLTIKDVGKGIDPKVMDRIFDPYFTTKDVDKGLGMGLAVVFGIVKKHDGAIKFRSRVGKGTTVEVLFPITAAQVETEVKEPDGLPMGTECILFVDDEVSLVKIGKQMIERQGYEVVGVTSSTEALKLFQAEPARFNLVITDMAMPDMAGDRLSRELIKIRPDIPVILCTGHSGRIDEDKAKALGIRAYTMKPLVSTDLAKTIRGVLNEAKSTAKR